MLAGRQHELDDRPPHVKRQEFLDSERGTEERGSAKTEFDECIFLEKMVADVNFLDQVEQYAFAVTLPTPEIEADWRRAIVKDFVNGAMLELNSDPAIIMAQLLTFAQQQVRHAVSMRRNLPEFVIEQELSIPAGYADLRDRQLNKIEQHTLPHQAPSRI